MGWGPNYKIYMVLCFSLNFKDGLTSLEVIRFSSLWMAKEGAAWNSTMEKGSMQQIENDWAWQARNPLPPTDEWASGRCYETTHRVPCDFSICGMITMCWALCRAPEKGEEHSTPLTEASAQKEPQRQRGPQTTGANWIRRDWRCCVCEERRRSVLKTTVGTPYGIPS